MATSTAFLLDDRDDVDEYYDGSLGEAEDEELEACEAGWVKEGHGRDNEGEDNGDEEDDAHDDGLAVRFTCKPSIPRRLKSGLRRGKQWVRHGGAMLGLKADDRGSALALGSADVAGHGMAHVQGSGPYAPPTPAGARADRQQQGSSAAKRHAAGASAAQQRERERERGGVVLAGRRKKLVYYHGRSGNSRKTNWVMHEYRLEWRDAAEGEGRRKGQGGALKADCPPAPSVPSKLQHVVS